MQPDARGCALRPMRHIGADHLPLQGGRRRVRGKLLILGVIFR